MVGVSHGNVARVRAAPRAPPGPRPRRLGLGLRRLESALGAASHVGNREIAELLLAHGARPSIFSAAMLGQLDVVNAFVTARARHPAHEGAARHHAPLACAGGRRRGAPVVAYLESVGDADASLALAPLSPADMERPRRLLHLRAAGKATASRSRSSAATSAIARTGGIRRGLSHLGAERVLSRGRRGRARPLRRGRRAGRGADGALPGPGRGPHGSLLA